MAANWENRKAYRTMLDTQRTSNAAALSAVEPANSCCPRSTALAVVLGLALTSSLVLGVVVVNGGGMQSLGGLNIKGLTIDESEKVEATRKVMRERWSLPPSRPPALPCGRRRGVALPAMC